jgi:hypothetical protein
MFFPTRLTYPVDPDFDIDVYNIHRWHTSSTQAGVALRKIRDSHVALPLPLYVRSLKGPANDGIARKIDNWKLVEPKAYAETLRDSLVAVTFTLFHYDIKEEDVWTAYVSHIRKLRPVHQCQVLNRPVNHKSCRVIRAG